MSRTQTRVGLSYFSRIGVTDNSSPEEKKTAFRALSMKYHPDKPGGDANTFVAIKEAYEELIQPPVHQRMHHQYTHPESRITIDNWFLKDDGNACIEISFRNMLFCHTIGNLTWLDYHWGLNGGNGGYLEISKANLRKANYVVTIQFVPAFGRNVTKEFKFHDPRSGFDKLVDKVKSLFR